MQNDVFEAVRAVATEVFGCAPDEVHPETKRGEIAEWDSLGHLRFCMAVEHALGVKLDADDILRLGSIADLCRCVDERRGNAG